MRQTHRFATAVLGLCFVIASPAVFANGGSADSGAVDLSAIRAQQFELRAAAQGGQGLFKDMDKRDRNLLIQRQTELLAMLEGKNDLTEFPDSLQVRAFNLLEEINAIINGVGDDRIVCDSVRRTGSHRKVKQCITVAERRRLQQETEEYMRQQNMRSLGGALGE